MRPYIDTLGIRLMTKEECKKYHDTRAYHRKALQALKMYNDEVSYSVIAGALNISEDTVYDLLKLARNGFSE